jgi:hypothetical protein
MSKNKAAASPSPATPAAPAAGTAPSTAPESAPQSAAPSAPAAAQERKFPKGAELARALSAAVALKRITPIDLYTVLVFALDEKVEMGCSLALARGVDLRDTDLTLTAVMNAAR